MFFRKLIECILNMLWHVRQYPFIFTYTPQRNMCQYMLVSFVDFAVRMLLLFWSDVSSSGHALGKSPVHIFVCVFLILFSLCVHLCGLFLVSTEHVFTWYKFASTFHTSLHVHKVLGIFHSAFL